MTTGYTAEYRTPTEHLLNRPLPRRVIDLPAAAFRALTGMDIGKVMVTVRMKPGSPK
ncbi:MAG: hypothetical protein WB710_12575 [Stellaceae bacterium]